MKIAENKMKILVLIGALISVGCAMEGRTTTSTDSPTVSIPGSAYIPSSVAPGYGSGGTYGHSVPLTIVDIPTLSEYAIETRNSPQAITVNLNMVKTNGGTYGGTLAISYWDNGIYHEQFFTAGQTAAATKYNQTFSASGKTVWHAIFEDFYIGGLVVVIDEVIDLGDGGGAQDLVSGSVWFKNFRREYAPRSPTYCWFVSVGPYDCRPWPSGNSVNTFASKDPQNGYTKLGTFSGLSIKKAFNGGSL